MQATATAPLERATAGTRRARPLVEAVRRVREHPFALDAALTVGFVAIAVVFTRAAGREIVAHPETYTRTRHVDALAYVLAIGAQLPIAWRRRWPVAALVTALAFAVPFELRHYPDIGLVPASVVVVYSLGAHAERRVSRRWALVFALVLAWLVTDGILNDPTQSRWLYVSNFLMFGTAYVVGVNFRQRRALADEYRDRAEQAEAQRESEAARAVVEERNRIARELHDIVAHSVGVMVIQASAAQRVLPTQPDRAAGALAAIETTGRDALHEMRRILGLLRNEGDGEPAAALAPQPSLDDLDALVDDYRRAGLPVDLLTTGDRRPLASAVELTAYRIVQESLTNVLKHAGPAHATVTLDFATDRLAIDVADDGRGAAADRPAHRGHGLRGMRERVDAFGGTLRAAPRIGGGYAVHAELPLHGAPR